MQKAFLPLLFRMRHIRRWGLMHSTQPESLSQHSLECSFLARFLACVGNAYLGADHNPDKVSARAAYHDAAEILTGDLPTPIKYFNSGILGAYKGVEEVAAARLLDSLPEELRGFYEPCLSGSDLTEGEARIIKAADKLCAYIKCLGETGSGNAEFGPALRSCGAKLEAAAVTCPELRYFMERFLEAFTLPLDELQGVFNSDDIK